MGLPVSSDLSLHAGTGKTVTSATIVFHLTRQNQGQARSVVPLQCILCEGCSLVRSEGELCQSWWHAHRSNTAIRSRLFSP